MQPLLLNIFNWIGQVLSYLPILFLILSSLYMRCLVSGWNEFRKAPYFPHVLSAPTEVIFAGTNNEITNTMMSHKHLTVGGRTSERGIYGRKKIYTSFIRQELYLSTHENRFVRGCPRGVMVKAMDYGIVVSEFVLQSRYYVHFRANTLGKGMNPLILPAMG